MKTFLLPNYFKKIGLVLFFVGWIAGFLTYGVDDFRAGMQGAIYQENLQHAEAFEYDSESIEHVRFGMTWTEGWTRFFDLLTIGGMLIYAVSRERSEDELYLKLRLETGWITFLIWLLGIFVAYSIWGEVDLSLSYTLGIPLVLFLIIFYYRKRNFA